MGQTRCGRTGCSQWPQYWICTGVRCWWLRLLPWRAWEVRRFGTAMTFAFGLPTPPRPAPADVSGGKRDIVGTPAGGVKGGAACRIVTPAGADYSFADAAHDRPRATAWRGAANIATMNDKEGRSVKIILANPRGFCAGVNMAIESLERALNCSARRCTSTTRSSTIGRWWSGSASAAWSSWIDIDEIPRGGDGAVQRPRRGPGHSRGGGGTPPAGHRRHLSAGDQGPPGGGALRARGLHDPADRPRGPRRGARHDGRGAGAHPVWCRTSREVGTARIAGRRDAVAYLTQTTLSVDDAEVDHRALLKRRFPAHRRPVARRHLLRHAEPPGGRQGTGARSRRRDRAGQSEQLEQPCVWPSWPRQCGKPAYLVDGIGEIPEGSFTAARRCSSRPAPAPRRRWWRSASRRCASASARRSRRAYPRGARQLPAAARVALCCPRNAGLTRGRIHGDRNEDQ